MLSCTMVVTNGPIRLLRRKLQRPPRRFLNIQALFYEGTVFKVITITVVKYNCKLILYRPTEVNFPNLQLLDMWQSASLVGAVVECLLPSLFSPERGCRQQLSYYGNRCPRGLPFEAMSQNQNNVRRLIMVHSIILCRILQIHSPPYSKHLFLTVGAVIH